MLGDGDATGAVTAGRHPGVHAKTPPLAVSVDVRLEPRWAKPAFCICVDAKPRDLLHERLMVGGLRLQTRCRIFVLADARLDLRDSEIFCFGNVAHGRELCAAGLLTH